MSDLRPGLLGDARTALVFAHQVRPRLAAGPAPRPDVTRERLDLLDVGVRVEAHRGQLVGRVTGAVPRAAPVVGQADLVQPAALDGERGHPLGDQNARIDRVTAGDGHGPAQVVQAPYGRQPRAHLAE